MARSLVKLFVKRAAKLARRQQKAWLSAAATVQRDAVRAGLRSAAPAKTARPRKPTATALPRTPIGTARFGPGRWEGARHLQVDNTRLDYACYTPSGTTGAGLPLVVMLHGCRQTASDFALGTRMNMLAEDRGFVVLYPQQAVSRQSHRCWRWFEPDATHGLAEADLIATLIGSETERLGIDPSRVYVAGLSAGAGMAALVALRHADLVCAVALHSGPVLGDAHSAMGGLRTMRHGAGSRLHVIDAGLANTLALREGIPTMILHGAQDKAVNMRNGAQVAEQFATLNGLAPTDGDTTHVGTGTRREYLRTDYRREGKVRVRYCLVRQLGHAWSGGDPRVKFHDAAGPDASRLIWQFFRGYRMRRG